MDRRYSLPVKRRFRSKWWERKDSLVSRKVSNMICALRNPQAGGGWSGETGDGEASYSSGPSVVCPWCFVRNIRGGYWAGPWKRVRTEDL